ncbi:MAG: GNAT family N-acetyltransferase, partial [Burkholderiaceae bacterium]|nr:GNAT family N-acetyltransferase [Burkholderiaceae bacterium]
DPQTQLSLDLPELSAYYARHDVQIGAAGGAAWERCAVGVPSLTLSLADNQRAVLPELERRQAVLAATGLDAPALAQGLRRLLDDAGLRQTLATNSRALVDGQGARKVALGLLMLDQAPLQLRPAELSDAECLWRWRNHPSTRQVSRSQEEIPLDTHRAWLERLLAAGQSRLFLAFLGSAAVGVIRFDPLPTSDTEAAFEVSLYLDPQLQGLGLGRALLQAGEAAMAATHADLALNIHAEVLPGNESSLALFRGAGYGPGATPLRFIKGLKP